MKFGDDAYKEELRVAAIMPLFSVDQALLLANDEVEKLQKNIKTLRDELEYFVARVECRHSDGPIRSKTTYERYKSALKATE